ncbi:hypothetical protein DFQ28_009172 [Apophysomyces sp. BC1034]|nr:hypothetical protein DFQ30_009712 [Apophysomyces sp. BC1015]KAG0176980.1 hypothetical protein DFQ29_005382 [Apophysomyces sp. BC1021]KAG0192447.1 hypothetical protein DFQ28_009172 [Apophysomyces sp. BC1034]
MVQTATQQSEPPSKQRRRLFDEEELDLSTTRENEGHPLDIPPTPLPKIQMLVIGIVLFSDPLTSTILFPFIYFMIKDFQITDDETEIGRYAGWITSVFFICQFFTAIPWGRFSDRHGRRPVMLIGLIGNSISTCLFGLSKNLWWAVGSRALCGIVNGNSGVARSMVTEITDETNRAAAFSIFGFCWGIGLIAGKEQRKNLCKGGFLCKPAEHFPSLFGNVQFLKDFPYFLPCLVSSIGSFGGYLLGYCCLKETNPDVIRRQKRANPDERTALLADDATARDEDDEPTTKNSSKIRQITKASYAVIVGYA